VSDGNKPFFDLNPVDRPPAPPPTDPMRDLPEFLRPEGYDSPESASPRPAPEPVPGLGGASSALESLFGASPPPSEASKPEKTARPSLKPSRPLPEDDDAGKTKARVQMRDLRNLPSKGLAYPEGAKIRYRTFLAWEVRQASSDEDVDLPRILRDIAMGIETTGFPKENITFYDFLFINLCRKLQTIRQSTVYATYPCSPEDGGCGHVNDFTVDVSAESPELEFFDLEFDSLPLEVDFSFGTHKFTPLTVGQYLQLEESGLENDDFANLAIQCTTLPFEEAWETFRFCADDDMYLLFTVEHLLHHGLKPLTRTCQNCSRELRFRLESGTVLIRPFRGPDVSLAGRIRSGRGVPLGSVGDRKPGLSGPDGASGAAAGETGTP